MEELKQIHSIINDVWQFVKIYVTVTDQESYWDNLVRDGGCLIEQYNRHPLCRKLVLAVIEYIRDEHRKETGAA